MCDILERKKKITRGGIYIWVLKKVYITIAKKLNV